MILNLRLGGINEMTIELPIKEDVILSCSNCEEEVSVDVLIQDLEYASSDERPMGTEYQYDFTSEVQCPNCNYKWEVEGDIWEYPEGAVNLIELRK